MGKANKKTIYDYEEGDLVDLYFYGELFRAKTPIIRIVDYGNGLVRYRVLDFLVTSNNLKKSEKNEKKNAKK